MPSKRAVLEHLSRDELLAVVDRFELTATRTAAGCMSGDDAPSERDIDPAYEFFIHKPRKAETIGALPRT